LDRYAEKDNSKVTLTEDTIVVATTKRTKNPITKRDLVTKEVCKFKGYDNGIPILEDYVTKEIYKIPLDYIIVPTENRPSQMFIREARAMKNFDDAIDWHDLLKDFKFVPGGRIMSMLGTSYQNLLTAYNCYVLPSPGDSRLAIMQAATEMIEIMARGGGVGMNISSLRPRNAIVRGVNGTSSGSVSWGGMFSYQTGLIEQGGSRRGALMLILSDWHPDIEEFITAKAEKGVIVNANLSVAISDKFMEAIKQDKDWVLDFPNTTPAA